MSNLFSAAADRGDMTDQYNTPLKPTEEATFQAWRAKLAADPATANLANLQDYDLRGAWKANAQAAASGHLPDTWKKPNHTTFSDGSIYAKGKNTAGTWAPLPNTSTADKPDGDWAYFADPSMAKYRTPDALLNYFQAYEQGNSVVLPNMFRRR